MRVVRSEIERKGEIIGSGIGSRDKRKDGEQEKEKENGKGKKRKICKGWALEGKAEAQEDGRREGYDRNRIGIE